METPICDFVRDYIKRRPMRLHMPGHKGASLLGFEEYDITEITGADSLYDAHGIISQSEECASRLFGCPTYYSTEGSSQCIRAMLYLLCLHAGKAPRIAVCRNAHKAFISAAALLDLEIDWLCPDGGSYLSCNITPEYLEEYFAGTADLPHAVYVTTPDYFGNMPDVSGIAEVCHKSGVLLLVDGAHGAYLRYLPYSLHPIDLGADMCCSSAHKTLPVLTGGAYLHVSDGADPMFRERARAALVMFGSTSPSYLILQSLDKVNEYLESYPRLLADFMYHVRKLKEGLKLSGYTLAGEEPLKLTLLTKEYGYTGYELAELLEKHSIFCEFADPEHLVMMLSPENKEDALFYLRRTLARIPKRDPIPDESPRFTLPRRAMSVREAALSPSETVAVEDAVGRVLAVAEVGCPPAVPIVVCGEEIDAAAASCMKYYGIKTCSVVAKK